MSSLSWLYETCASSFHSFVGLTVFCKHSKHATSTESRCALRTCVKLDLMISWMNVLLQHEHNSKKAVLFTKFCILRMPLGLSSKLNCLLHIFILKLKLKTLSLTRYLSLATDVHLWETCLNSIWINKIAQNIIHVTSKNM